MAVRRWACVAALLLAQSLRVLVAQAQVPELESSEHIGLNVLVGGLSAGIGALLRGEDPVPAVARGALGGLVWYTGKATAAARFEGAGFLGRQIAAVGASISRNAGEGRTILSRVVLPVGPLRIDVTRLDPGEVRTQIHVWDLAAIVYGVAKSDLRFAADESLSAGIPIFVADDRTLRARGLDVNGYATGGVIIRSGLIMNATRPSVLAHERVHVLQHDFTSHVWSDPLEDLYIGNALGSTRVSNRVVLGVAQSLFSGLLLTVSDPSPLTRWFESEAADLDGSW